MLFKSMPVFVFVSLFETIMDRSQTQDPDVMWPKRRKSDLVVRPGGDYWS